jgi:alpha-glutamyl/putrescinyl thymine pyrophosphorylase-like protein
VVPEFCRHNRFVERCPICRQTIPGNGVGASRGGSATRSAARPQKVGGSTRTGTRESLKVHRETRALDDNYRSPLVPGLRSSEDARRLAEEIGFSVARLVSLGADPPGLYAEVRTAEDLEQATWLGFLIAYLCPVEGDEPFAPIAAAVTDWHGAELPDLDGVALGPRSSHEPARGLSTLLAYRQWAQRAASQARGFQGDAGWSAERRFERIFERLSLPGFGRVGRYDLLVSLGRLGLYEMRADSLHLVGSDPATVAAKRVFGIGDRINLERRARALADAAEVPIESLDLALANWGSSERATLGQRPDAVDTDARERALAALGL